MRVRNSVVAAVIGLPLAWAPGQAQEKQQPVLVLLHSRFEDHVNIGIGEDRVFRLLALIETLRKEQPAQPLTVNMQFSGTFAANLGRTPSGKGYLDHLKALARNGAVTIGYSGEHEPTYRNRPKPVLKEGMTAEQRWLAQTEAAERYLNDYKDPFTGNADRSRSGGIRAVREAIGEPVVSAFGFAPELGGEAPYLHQFRRSGIDAVYGGFPDPYFTMNIHGYRNSAVEIGKAMSPAPDASPEVFWDNNFLRASFTSSADVRRVYAEEGKDALKGLLEKLDRSRVRLVQIEVASYARYLEKWPDGTPKLFPLIWAYDHPERPDVPGGIRAFVVTATSLKAYDAEEEALRWLTTEFLPKNPGSRFVSPADLLRMAKTRVGSEVSSTTLTAAVKDWATRAAKETNMSPTYVEVNGAYYSAADLFQLLATSLAAMNRNWQRPEMVKLNPVFGPIAMEEADETFPEATVTAGEVARVAAELAPRLNDRTWRPAPSNAIPVRTSIAGKRLIPPQFLALMTEAYLAPSRETALLVLYFQSPTAPGFFFPRQNGLIDAGNIWTLRPAPLDLK